MVVGNYYQIGVDSRVADNYYPLEITCNRGQE